MSFGKRIINSLDFTLRPPWWSSWTLWRAISQVSVAWVKPGCDVILNHISGEVLPTLNTRLVTQETRVLDPILYELLDPSILRIPSTFKVRGREIPGFLYERPFDQSIVNHLLETLLSMVTFGGQGFAKAARTSSIKRSHHSGLIQRVANSMYITPSIVVKK